MSLYHVMSFHRVETDSPSSHDVTSHIAFVAIVLAGLLCTEHKKLSAGHHSNEFRTILHWVVVMHLITSMFQHFLHPNIAFASQKSSSKSSKGKEESSKSKSGGVEKDKGEEGGSGESSSLSLPGSDGEPLDKETIRRVSEDANNRDEMRRVHGLRSLLIPFNAGLSCINDNAQTLTVPY